MIRRVCVSISMTPHIQMHPISPLSEGGMIRLETLIELEFLDSSFSSVSPYFSKAPKGNGIGATGSKNPPAY